MRLAHAVADVRAAEAELMATLPAGALMQRAAGGLARTCADLLRHSAGRVYGGRVVLLVGSGDNGGDALYAGGRLAARGARVDALLLDPERAHPGGLAALLRAGGRRTGDASVLERAHLVVDGIVGIGGTGALRPAAAEFVDRARASRALIVAVDLPSGVDADTGAVAGAAVRADATVTFGTWKPGLLVDPGAGHAGALSLVDIGLAPHLPPPAVRALQAEDVAAALPTPGRESDKYGRGVVGVVAGSTRYAGAAVLAVGGAMRGGAGMVRFVGSGAAAASVRAAWPEVLVSEGAPAEAGRVQAWVVGPGLGTDREARARLVGVLRSEVPVLVDADALTILAGGGPLLRPAATLFTPHAGELARLLGVERDDVESARLASARRAADAYGVVVLLKGSTTVIASPGGGPAYVNPTGTGWLGTAGSGDVLAGLGGALLAGGLQAGEAGAVAAYLHGLAARFAMSGGGHGEGPVTAAGIAAAIPAAWQAVTS